MRKTILLLCILSISINALSQSKEKELSNAEKFSAKSGGLIQKQFYEIGEIKSAEIQVVVYTDLITSQRETAVKIEYEHKSSYSTSTKTAVLDADEVDGLIKSIKLMQEKIFPTTATTYTEVSFKARGGFEAGCYWSKEQWATYMKLEKYDSDSYVFLKQDDFPELLSLLEQAKAKL